MIASLRGQIKTVKQDRLVVEVMGVGYSVHVPAALVSKDLRTGQTIELYTHLHVRENDLTLYGFQTTEELELFEVLITVNGIGPRTALAALSVFSPENLRSIIAQGNAVALARIPGIGRKTAERLVVDLKDKVGPAAGKWAAVTLQEGDADVINALTALGYSLAEAQEAVGSVESSIQDLDQRILEALRFLGSR